MPKAGLCPKCVNFSLFEALGGEYEKMSRVSLSLTCLSLRQQYGEVYKTKTGHLGDQPAGVLLVFTGHYRTLCVCSTAAKLVQHTEVVCQY